MNKTELTAELAKATDMTQREAEKAINALFKAPSGTISGALEKEGRVQITGFGTFETRKRSTRMGRNPQTGEKIKIPATITVNFRSGKGLKDAVN